MKYFFSIITICYNEINLERTCKSIVSQDFEDYEWIVIDGGSNQSTLDTFKLYKDNINLFISEPDNGVYDAMNKGIDKINGKWVIFLNAGDCFCNTNILQKIHTALIQSDCDVIYGDYFAGNSNIIVQTPLPQKDDLYLKNINQQSAFVRDYILKKCKFNLEFKYCSDWDFWLKLLMQNYKFMKVHFPIANFYEDGISHNNNKEVFKEVSAIRKKYFIEAEILAIKKLQMLTLRQTIVSKKERGSSNV